MLSYKKLKFGAIMFDVKTYIRRREILKKKIKSGIIILPGNEEIPMNYPANTYRFRQDSSFLYYFGLDVPNLIGMIDADSGEEIIFGNDFELDDIIWMGPQPTVKSLAAKSGVKKTFTLSKTKDFVSAAILAGRKVHFLPQYHSRNQMTLADLTGIMPKCINEHKSVELIKAVIEQRLIKSSEEVKEIEYALGISMQMHMYAMLMTSPGLFEREVAGGVDGITYAMGMGNSFPTIFSVHGETLHNHHYDNLMKSGDLVVNDSGAESFNHYASDITRTFPVNGKFTQKQKEIYSIVLDAQLKAIQKMKPGINFKDVHMTAAKVIASGLKDIGLMKGNIDDAVRQGAHALFFSHGLGHNLGLDVHDLEGLGEDYIGYDEKIHRSNQFGLAYLRYSKELKPGIVITVEPGIYFIPQLIDLWKSENKFKEFINYNKLESYRTFGGVRIEDDVLITRTGSRVLGNPIPKEIDEVEYVCNEELREQYTT